MYEPQLNAKANAGKKKKRGIGNSKNDARQRSVAVRAKPPVCQGAAAQSTLDSIDSFIKETFFGYIYA